MRNICGILLLVLFLDHNVRSQNAVANYQTIYDGLQEHGYWFMQQDSSYSWAPSKNDFIPFISNGRWIRTNKGLCWHTEESYAWAVYHYGEWKNEAGLGWVWTPGTEWRTAPVKWRITETGFGWLLSSSKDSSSARWTFVPSNRLLSRDLRRWMQNPKNPVKDSRSLTVSDSVLLNMPLAADSDSTLYSLRDNLVPGNKVIGKNYFLYRPRIDNKQGKPEKVHNVAEIKAIRQRENPAR
jgi:hypothetical protein